MDRTTADIYAVGETAETVENTGAVETTETTQTELPTGDKPEPVVLNDAAKHFQSLADKRLAENERLRMELEQIRQKETQQVKPEVQALTLPVKPQRPIGYDRVEALTDPNSASFKYEEQMEAYRDALADYQIKVVEEKTKFLDEARKQKEEEQKHLSRKAMALSDFQAAGADPKEASEAYEFLSSPESLKADFLLKAFRAYKGQSTQSQQKINNMNLRKERQGEPLPAGVAGQGVQTDDAQSFIAGLQNAGKKNLFAIKQ